MKLLKTLALEQKEDAHHGKALFPLQKYITQLDKEHPVVTTHWHDEAEFTLVKEGSAEYQINLEDYAITAGDLVFIQPRILHTIALNSTEQIQQKYFQMEQYQQKPFQLESFQTEHFQLESFQTEPFQPEHFQLESFQTKPFQPEHFQSETYVFHLNYLGANATDICATRYLLPLINEEYTLPCHISPDHPAYASLKAVFSQISGLYEETPPGYELAIKICLLQAIFLLLPYGVSGKNQDTDSASEKLKTVLDYIHLHYADALSIKELAAQCYFSEYYFMRFFKKHMHMTVIEYLNNLRMEKAVELFEQGYTSIIEVSMSVGFHSLSYFHKVFREKFSMTPKQFLQQLKES